MRVNGLWKFNQCGFKADHRTQDSLFILNTIYEKYINMENKTVYTTFVDFSLTDTNFPEKLEKEIMYATG